MCTEFIDIDSPIPAGWYYSDVLIPSNKNDYPETYIKNKILIDHDGDIEHTLVMRDTSLQGNASFHFSAHLLFCALTRCLIYIPRGEVLTKPHIKETIYDSKYLQVLSSYKKSYLGLVDVLYKDNDVIFLSITRKGEHKYRLYAIKHD